MTNHWRSGIVALIAAAAVTLLIPTAALASGSFGTRYVNEDLSYTFREHMRKIFRSGEQSRRYYAGKERAFYQRLAGTLPKVRRVLARARKKKIPIATYSVTNPVIRLTGVKAVASIDRAAFPLNLAVEHATPGSTDTLEFSFRRRPRARDLAWLVSSVRKALAAGAGEEAEAAAPPELKRVSPAVCKLSDKFGIYVGANIKTDPAGKTALERAFSAELKLMMLRMRKRLAATSALDDLGIKGGLLPLKPVVTARGLPDPCRVFNPHGPLVDGKEPELVRTSHQKGSMMVTVLVAPKAYDWGKLNPTFHRWLDQMLVDERHVRARQEQSYLVLADRDSRQRRNALSELSKVRTPRFEKALARIILDWSEPASLREEATRILSRFDAPRPYRTLVKVLATAPRLDEYDGALALSCRALGQYPRKEAARLLIKIRGNAKADWNTRNDCDASLKAMAEKLKDGHPLKAKILGLKKL